MAKRGKSDVWDHATQAAPWREEMADGSLGPEYLPISARTGRAVAQSTAQRDYAESYDAVDAGGLWDHAEVAAERSRPVAPTEPRYDEPEMRVYVERHGSELTGHQWEVYTRFWVERRSYAWMARKFSCSVSNVRGTIAVLRRGMATRVLARQQTIGQVRCPRCQAKSEVMKVRHAEGVTIRDRLCLECKHAFRTDERVQPAGRAE